MIFMADKKKIVLIMLVAISVFVWLRGLGVLGNNRRAKNYPGGALSSSSSSARQARRSEYKDYKRNPFTAASVSQSQGAGLQLSGIIYDEKGLYALINDQIVHLADKIGEYTVIDITQGKVILNDGAKNVELKLEE